ncbi:MAG: hypothetical protein GX051_00115 [Clostridiales bacterium]|nr:hypothetical protein [Clostridiales bacterium]
MMKRNNKALSVVALMLTVSILILGAGCTAKDKTDATTLSETTTAVQPVYSAAPASVEKSETVYMHLNPDGSVKSTLVTDWLHTDSAGVRVEDTSTLSDIKNVRSGILPVFENGKLVWNMDTTDLYYSGITDKAAPVAFNIKYYLNDAECSADAIAGKSGKIKIVVSIKNLDAHTVDINGVQTVLYNPLIVVGGMVMPYDHFTGISIDNGRLLGDGSKQLPLIVAAPGMNESLNLGAIDIPELEFSLADTFTITADATNFELGNMYFGVLPLSSLDLGLSMPSSISEVTDDLKLLTDLQDVFEKLNADGALTALVSNPDSLAQLAQVVNKGVNVYKQNKKLLEVTSKYLTADNAEKLTKLMKDLDDEQLKQALALFSRPEMKYLFENLSTLAADMQALQPLIESLSADMNDPEVKAAIENLPQTISTISEIKSAIDDNEELLTALSTLMKDDNIDAITSVLDGLTATLSDEEFQKKYSAVIGNAGDIIVRMEKWLDIGNSYKIFTDAPSEFKTSVMFVCQTDGISAAK